MKRPRPFALAALFLPLLACDGVDIAPLYELEVDLCAPENAEAFAARVADCRARFVADGSCAGVFSMSGMLLEEPITVDAELDESSLVDAELPDDTFVRDRVSMLGASPYFRFVLIFYLLGGAIDLGDTNRPLTIGGAMSHPPGWSSDSSARADLRISAPPDSDDLSISSGEVVITRQTLTESAGTFSFVRGENTALDGCFHAFTNLRTTSMESP